jgi:phosphatidylinositol alpha 1,6-mannosyltransferase
VVAESFLPQVNGVANSVRHLVDQLVARGHQALIIAPGPGETTYADDVPVVRVRSFPFPIYRDLPLGLPDASVRRAITEFAPDVVHLASPIVVGMSGLRAAERLGIPTVAIYQTDIVGFGHQYGLVGIERTIWAWTRHLYGRAGRTLAPSSAAAAQLEANRVPRIHIWQRGVDLRQFRPSRRSEDLRRSLAPNGEVLVGYVGRVAMEKRVHMLRHLADLPGTRLVIVGDGPELDEVRRQAPSSVSLGMLHREELAAAVASLDVFVHTGAHETFCQAAQEALASGVPVVAPAAGGLLDLVTPGETGFLYAPEDSAAAVAELREGVQTLAANPLLRRAMGQAARMSVLERGWERIIDELVNTHYRAVMRPAASRDTVAA